MSVSPEETAPQERRHIVLIFVGLITAMLLLLALAIPQLRAKILR